MVTSDMGGREVKMNKPHPDPLLKEREQAPSMYQPLVGREPSARHKTACGRGLNPVPTVGEIHAFGLLEQYF